MTNTRLLENKIFLCIFSFLFIILKINSTFSHECVLKDTTPKEITIYNSCLSQKNSNYNIDAKKLKKWKKKL